MVKKLLAILNQNPSKGKPAKKLLKKLSKHFKVPSGQIKIKSDHKAREKIVKVLR